MTYISTSKRILCCNAAGATDISKNSKPYNNPDREVHQAILLSFLNFASRQQLAADEEEKRLADDPVAQLRRLLHAACNPEPSSPLFTLEALQNNPLTPQTSYAIHLTSRLDFGPVYSHRYFICPQNLEHDWVEMTLVHWFAEGEPFKMKADKMDIKCKDCRKFFRLTLRPNLAMRACIPVAVKGIAQGDLIAGAERCGGGRSQVSETERTACEF